MLRNSSSVAISSSMGGPSHEVIAIGSILERNLAASPTILDLGCGDGRNSFMLAGLGCVVTAVDLSDTYLGKLRDLVSLFPRKIETIRCNATNFEFNKTYNCILSHGLLHFLSRNEIQHLIRSIKISTSEGGVNVFTTAFADSSEDLPADFIKDGHQNSLAIGELLSYYCDWETISYERYTKWDFHPDKGYHAHPIEKLIFRKAGGQPIALSSQEIQLNRLKKYSLERVINVQIIGKSEIEVFKLLGVPDFEFNYKATGPQYSFRSFSNSGYRLKLLFYDNIMLYCSNGTISGYSCFETNFFFLA